MHTYTKNRTHGYKRIYCYCYTLSLSRFSGNKYKSFFLLSSFTHRERESSENEHKKEEEKNYEKNTQSYVFLFAENSCETRAFSNNFFFVFTSFFFLNNFFFLLLLLLILVRPLILPLRIFLSFFFISDENVLKKKSFPPCTLWLFSNIFSRVETARNRKRTFFFCSYFVLLCFSFRIFEKASQQEHRETTKNWEYFLQFHDRILTFISCSAFLLYFHAVWFGFGNRQQNKKIKRNILNPKQRMKKRVREIERREEIESKGKAKKSKNL